MSQIGLYLESFFFPPFGLIPAIKYLRQSDGKSKIVGISAILITILTIMIAISVIAGVLGTINKMLNSGLNSSLYGF